METLKPVGRKNDLSRARETYAALVASDRAVNDQLASKIVLAIWRAGQVLSGVPGPTAFVLRRLWQVADAVVVRGLVGAELPPQVRVGPGLCLAHAARGVVMHPDTVIGAGCKIYHQVTIGVRDESGAPVIHDGVMLGAGCKVLGPVIVAEGTQVGANAVLVSSTESGGTYVGIPARPVNTRGGKS